MYTHDFCSVESLVNYSHFHCSAAVRIASSTLIFNHFHINTERCRERAGEVERSAPNTGHAQCTAELASRHACCCSFLK